ncbi:hypothetical protein R3P38DRAFT_3534850 [Favolaschia claudopus]|uniref:CCHC-type domain-containing protein n=1 Tax=Favolaschia claudopus TaxID=2862362 RepID=A0AAW0BBR7_9AGAR
MVRVTRSGAATGPITPASSASRSAEMDASKGTSDNNGKSRSPVESGHRSRSSDVGSVKPHSSQEAAESGQHPLNTAGDVLEGESTTTVVDSPPPVVQHDDDDPYRGQGPDEAPSGFPDLSALDFDAANVGFSTPRRTTRAPSTPSLSPNLSPARWFNADVLKVDEPAEYSRSGPLIDWAESTDDDGPGEIPAGWIKQESVTINLDKLSSAKGNEIYSDQLLHELMSSMTPAQQEIMRRREEALKDMRVHGSSATSSRSSRKSSKSKKSYQHDAAKSEPTAPPSPSTPRIPTELKGKGKAPVDESRKPRVEDYHSDDEDDDDDNGTIRHAPEVAAQIAADAALAKALDTQKWVEDVAPNPKVVLPRPVEKPKASTANLAHGLQPTMNAWTAKDQQEALDADFARREQRRFDRIRELEEEQARVAQRHAELADAIESELNSAGGDVHAPVIAPEPVRFEAKQTPPILVQPVRDEQPPKIERMERPFVRKTPLEQVQPNSLLRQTMNGETSKRKKENNDGPPSSDPSSSSSSTTSSDSDMSSDWSSLGDPPSDVNSDDSKRTKRAKKKAKQKWNLKYLRLKFEQSNAKPEPPFEYNGDAVFSTFEAWAMELRQWTKACYIRPNMRVTRAGKYLTGPARIWYLRVVAKEARNIGDVSDRAFVLRFWANARWRIRQRWAYDGYDPETATWKQLQKAAINYEQSDKIQDAERKTDSHQKEKKPAPFKSSNSNSNSQHGGKRDGQAKPNNGGKSVRWSKDSNADKQRKDPKNNGKGGANNSNNEKRTKNRHNLTKAQLDEYRAQGKCFTCEDTQHLSKDCPKNNSVKPSGQKGSSASISFDEVERLRNLRDGDSLGLYSVLLERIVSSESEPPSSDGEASEEESDLPRPDERYRRREGEGYFEWLRRRIGLDEEDNSDDSDMPQLQEVEPSDDESSDAGSESGYDSDWDDEILRKEFGHVSSLDGTETLSDCDSDDEFFSAYDWEEDPPWMHDEPDTDDDLPPLMDVSDSDESESESDDMPGLQSQSDSSEDSSDSESDASDDLSSWHLESDSGEPEDDNDQPCMITEPGMEKPPVGSVPLSLKERRELWFEEAKWDIGDLLADGAHAMLESLRPYPGDEFATDFKEDELTSRFDVAATETGDYYVWDALHREMTFLPKKLLKIKSFAIGNWYAARCRRMFGLPKTVTARRYQMPIGDLYWGGMQNYLHDVDTVVKENLAGMRISPYKPRNQLEGYFMDVEEIHDGHVSIRAPRDTARVAR